MGVGGALGVGLGVGVGVGSGVIGPTVTLVKMSFTVGVPPPTDISVAGSYPPAATCRPAC